jgi:hypothetical protein
MGGHSKRSCSSYPVSELPILPTGIWYYDDEGEYVVCNLTFPQTMDISVQPEPSKFTFHNPEMLTRNADNITWTSNKILRIISFYEAFDPPSTPLLLDYTSILNKLRTTTLQECPSWLNMALAYVGD